MYTTKGITVGIRLANIRITETFELRTFTCSVFEWFVIQMPGTFKKVRYSNGGLNNELLVRNSNGDLNNELKVRYSGH